MSISLITKILNRAIEGDYSERVDTNLFDGEERELAESVNTAIEFIIDSRKTCDNVMMLIEQNPKPMIIVDHNFNPVDMNRAYSKLMGAPKSELMRQDTSQYSIKTLKGESASTLFSDKKETECELEFTLKDGTKKILRQFGAPLKDERGSVEIGLFVYDDVTIEREEEKEIEKQIQTIKTLQERSETIVQQNPMPIILCDKQFNIRVVNDAYAQLSGINSDKLRKMTLRDFSVIRTEGDGIKYVLEEKNRSYGEVTVKFPTGEKILEQYGIPVLNNDKEIASILIVYNDITEIREKQQEVLRMMEEERARARVLNKSIGEVGEGMEFLRKGDFTSEMKIIEEDPLIQIKKDYNGTVSELRNIFSGVVTAMGEVGQHMKDADGSSEEVAKAAEQVAVGSQKCAELTKTLLDQIDGINRDIADLSASNEEIAGTSQEVLSEADRLSDMGHSAESLGKSANDKMGAVMEITRNTVFEMEELNAEMLEINNVLKMINEITNQINMLALNAAIEAARAGEHGRGFAVVAGEVKNLATDAKKATSKIDKVIENIQKSSSETVSSIKSANDEVELGVNIVNETIASLNNIVTGANHVTRDMGEIVRAIEAQANITNEIVHETEKSNQVTKETQREIEELAAFSEETSASVEEISGAISEVNSLADNIKQNLNRLRV
ncbi:methyl-accepting chemotaxis protein [Methanoplanus endosymbiosus]|uniref:PAS domain-containing methyl-accepting chemotaxis protein n=1 Tax=Methanoplanus endosymbiosus TaxID=33865 RepID=A0A9E7PJQ6_9EURY|nr:PAS domain-containing methyl-accepting chemotaxis protein [Methanoplanus endosymbiosus]UUX91208.1 PAS domain-containing methyl-accepting chemotaxis protein [Methanoplanus endosymbiosus]